MIDRHPDCPSVLALCCDAEVGSSTRHERHIFDLDDYPHHNEAELIAIMRRAVVHLGWVSLPGRKGVLVDLCPRHLRWIEALTGGLPGAIQTPAPLAAQAAS